MTPRHYLDFERPIAELEGKIDELSTLSGGGFDTEVASLRSRVAERRREAYANLDPWQKTQVARHPQRPHFLNFVGALIEGFTELRGDRGFEDDQAIVGGLGRFRGTAVVVLGHEKGHDIQTRLRHNFGASKPEGHRKVVRLMDLAERFDLPVLSFVDTAGAYPGLAAEERSQAESIARSTERGLTLGVPFVATITGEGGSGGAIALAAANTVLMLEHSIYSVISPEGAASILYRDGSRAAQAAAAMKITAQDLLERRVIDAIVPEPVGGAHADPERAMVLVGDAIERALGELAGLDAAGLRAQRAERFYAIGRG